MSRIFAKKSISFISILIANACLFLIGIATVHSEGVSITFGNLSVGGTQPFVTQSWNPGSTQPSGSATGNASISVSPDVNIENLPLFMSILTNYLHNYEASQTQTPTPSTPSNLILYQSNISSSVIVPKPEPTDELMRPLNFSPLSADEPLLPQAEPYVIKVCLPYNNITASGCVDQKTSSQASEALASMTMNKYLNGVEIRPFRIIMPSSMPIDQQTQMLSRIETEAITIIEARMLKVGSQQNQNAIIENAKIARQEARSGINWSHNLREDRSSHDFRTGKAFGRLNNIAISGH